MAKRKKENKTQHSVAEMEVMAADLEKEIFKLRNDLAMQRKLEKPHLLKAKRHERARLLTTLTQNRRKAT
ncbi:MAG: ribosomal protein [Parachlamydiales bacterium]|nr:ribosomal protein [Parachlamydiales bacterium]